MPCKWLGNSFRSFLCPAAGLHAGLTRFHTYFNTAETVRKLRDMHKRFRKLGYSVHPSFEHADHSKEILLSSSSFSFPKKKRKQLRIIEETRFEIEIKNFPR